MGAELMNYSNNNNSNSNSNSNNNYNRNIEMYHQEVEDDFSDSELVSHVRNALNSAISGDKDNYSQLLGLLHYNQRLSPEDVALLVTSLKAMSGAVSYIDSTHHEDLLRTVFDMSMWNYGPDVMDALVELITSLAVSSGKYVDCCLGMLVSNFRPPPSFVKVLNLPFGDTRKKQVLLRVHSALDYISSLVPLAPARLLPILLDKMPRVKNRIQEPELVMFVENMFKLECSEIGELVGNRTLILAVVDLLVDFDVEIGWDDILEENPSKGIFEMELEDELLFSDDEDGGEFPRESWGKRLWKDEVHDKLQKLDSLMAISFGHLKSCKDDGRLVEVFESLLQSFQKTVLNAYKSKFAQFVIFYACSLDPDNCGEKFAELLADIYTCRTAPPLTRMSAVAYLASYLSRARFLSTSFVTDMLTRIVKTCSEYDGLRNGVVDPKAHSVFYAGCQATMYILCFHMRLILDVPHLKAQISSLPIAQILKNPLHPLKVCLPSIVEEFHQQAKSANLLDVRGVPVFHDILESELSMAFGGVERLDMFFPFDPCLLRKSDSYIRPNFVYWSMVKKTYEPEDEDSSDDEIEVFYPDTNRPGSPDAGTTGMLEEDEYLDEFNDSLNKMSITPKDSLLQKFGGRLNAPMQMPSRLRPSTSPESL